MIAAVVLSVGVMLAFADAISHFIEDHPTLKILALAFLILIGVMLILEGVGTHVEKGYVYFAMAFSLAVELVNLKVRRRQPVQLRQTYVVRDDYVARKPSKAAETTRRIDLG
jgi:predicted tellurium resistance membrane protein TerC